MESAHKEDKKVETIKKSLATAIQNSPLGYHVDHGVMEKFYQSYQASNKFNLENSLLCASNFDVDRALTLKEPVDPAVLVGVPYSVTTNLVMYMDSVWLDHLEVQVKPIAVFSKYIDTIESTGGSYNLIKKKGFERKEASQRTLASYFPGLKACDETLDVTSKYSYSQTTLVHPSTTVPHTVQLAAGSYVTYQSAILYACRITFTDESEDPEDWIKYAEDYFKRPENEGLRYKIGPNRSIYILFTVYRDQMIVKPYNDDLYSPVPFDELVEYCFNRGFTRWANTK
ncbi:hypothetical protein DFA_07724 [Cavenderia fasciculata]|uniref:Monalysin Pore-forming domain-containing protein n=1 Tax=Cavenderia fasciculata TaxID=261658 RepID=F4Q2X0_CACFS|nr:uncharacterized protein DFA_07724 [Cavenderia fasciculata]EGG16746.1 hypothetical protein DFA_07724 [Cavenderia fasciculata]|eukprot:XP_004355220.1 hypothetical protein DFA_07724 [Cavenderia fasciculata]